MSSHPRLIVLEDHPLVLGATVEFLVTHIDDSQVVYAGASVEQARQIIGTTGADCIVLDLDLGDGSSPLETIVTLNEFDVPIVVVSALGDSNLIRGALALGVVGFVSKRAEPAELLTAIHAAFEGEQYTSSELAATLLASPAPSVALSAQEQKALVLFASGMKMTTVARQMGVNVATTREYIKRVRQKYAKAGNPLPTKVDLYQQARAEGLLP